MASQASAFSWRCPWRKVFSREHRLCVRPPALWGLCFFRPGGWTVCHGLRPRLPGRAATGRCQAPIFIRTQLIPSPTAFPSHPTTSLLPSLLCLQPNRSSTSKPFGREEQGPSPRATFPGSGDGSIIQVPAPREGSPCSGPLPAPVSLSRRASSQGSAGTLLAALQPFAPSGISVSSACKLT